MLWPYAIRTYDEPDTREQVSAQESGSDSEQIHSTNGGRSLSEAPSKPGSPEGDNRRSGAPANGSTMRRGFRATKLPAAMRHLEAPLYRFREFVRGELIETQGRNLTTYEEALLQSAGRHESRALLAATWLRKETDLPLNERLSLLKEISAATDSRDKCLEKLGLDKLPKNNADPWASLSQPPALPPTPPVTEEKPNA